MIRCGMIRGFRNYCGAWAWRNRIFPEGIRAILARRGADSAVTDLLPERLRRPWLAAPAGCYFASKGCEKRIGMPKLEPPNPFKIATVTPMTFPSRLKSGPPEPPE